MINFLFDVNKILSAVQETEKEQSSETRTPAAIYIISISCSHILLLNHDYLFAIVYEIYRFASNIFVAWKEEHRLAVGTCFAYCLFNSEPRINR